MGFKEAIRTCVRDKYATFSGRASRSEYWYFFLFVILVASVLIGVGAVFSTGNSGQISTLSGIFFGAAGLFYLGMLIPMIAAGVRRFHDRNLSGWWYLGAMVAGAIPFVGIAASIAALVITVLKGTDGENKFGEDPLLVQNRADVFS